MPFANAHNGELFRHLYFVQITKLPDVPLHICIFIRQAPAKQFIKPLAFAHLTRVQIGGPLGPRPSCTSHIYADTPRITLRVDEYEPHRHNFRQFGIEQSIIAEAPPPPPHLSDKTGSTQIMQTLNTSVSNIYFQ